MNQNSEYMINFFRIAFVACFCFIATAVSAQIEQQHPIDTEIDQCKAAKSSLLGQIECELQGYQKWSAEMERMYTLLLERLRGDAELILKEEQLAWVALRDVRFEFYDKFYGNQSGQYLTLIASSKTDFVRHRAKELQLRLNEIR